MQECKRRQEGSKAPPGNVSRTFLTDVMEKAYSEEEIFPVLVESDQDRKRRRMLTVVTETVEAHRLQKMRDLLTFEKLATWRRMNGFDRVADGEDNWPHGLRIQNLVFKNNYVDNKVGRATEILWFRTYVAGLIPDGDKNFFL